MRRIEVDVLGDDVNSWVIQLPGRKFPGMVMQGDSLKILYGLACDLCDGAEPDSPAFEAASQLRDTLSGYLVSYQKALAAHGIDLPFAPLE